VATPASASALGFAVLTAPSAAPGSTTTAAATDNTVRQHSFLKADSSHAITPPIQRSL